MIKSRYHL